MQNDVATIARGLKDKQKLAIVSAKTMFGTMRLNGAPSTLHALKRKGITCGPFADCFTDPLGLAVRAHLLTEVSNHER